MYFASSYLKVINLCLIKFIFSNFSSAPFLETKLRKISASFILILGTKKTIFFVATYLRFYQF